MLSKCLCVLKDFWVLFCFFQLYEIEEMCCGVAELSVVALCLLTHWLGETHCGVRASGYHLKEYCGSDSHPVQLDLKGSVEGEVSVIITAAPFRSVTAVVNIHVQSDCLLLWDRCSCITEGWGVGGGGVERQEDNRQREQKKRRWTAWWARQTEEWEQRWWDEMV